MNTTDENKLKNSEPDARASKGHTSENNIKDKTIKAAVIGAIATLLAAIISAFIGVYYGTGKGIEQTAIYYNEKIVTSEDYEALRNERDNLYKEKVDLTSETKDLNTQKEKLEKTIEELEKENKEFASKPDIKFESSQLIIDGIPSGFTGSVAYVNNKKYYEEAFFKSVVDSQDVSNDDNNVYVGDIQTEDKMPVSLFELPVFNSTNYAEESFNVTDSLGNTHPQAIVYESRYESPDKQNQKKLYLEYKLDKKFKKISFKLAYGSDSDFASLIIYSNDTLLYTSPNMEQKSESISVELDISERDYIAFICYGTSAYKKLILYDIYLYP